MSKIEDEIKIGAIEQVTVSEIHSYGVRVTRNGDIGFIQIVELSWDNFGIQERLHEICEAGDVIEVKILSLTESQFYASLREASPELDPWFEKNIPATGSSVCGQVVLVAEHGYWVKLPNKLVSVLPLNASGVALRVDQIVEVMIESVERDAKKIHLKTDYCRCLVS